MNKRKVYICFDYDHDKDIKESLVAQAKLNDLPFEIIDMSIQAPIDENWKKEARLRIKKCEHVIVLCGKSTSSALGVAAELTIVQEEKIPYFLLKGRKGPGVEKPKNAKTTDEIHSWKWKSIIKLFG